MSVRDIVRPFDPTEPPEGVRLVASVVAGEIGITVREMAEVLQISKTALDDLICSNRWPVRTPRAQIEEGLRSYFATRGATPEQLQALFHAHVARAGTRTARELRNGSIYVSTPPRAPKSDKPNPNEETDVLLAKQTLTHDARKAFSIFGSNPFDGEVESAEQMFTSGEIRFVREACWQAAVNARFVAVVGESGAGKTTLLADLKERIATEGRKTIVIEPSVLGMEDSNGAGRTLKAADILHAIVATLNPLATVGQTIERRTRQAEQLLAGSMSAGGTHLLLIEEGHSLPIPTLKHLKRLHERMRLNGRKPMLGILILGQPELKTKLDERRHDVREVVQRIEMVELQPLGNDLKGYLQHRAKLAGRALADFMDDSAIEAVRERLTVLRPGVRNAPVSLLYPLAVNNTITACLNKAAGIGAPLVTRDVVLAI